MRLPFKNVFSKFDTNLYVFVLSGRRKLPERARQADLGGVKTSGNRLTVKEMWDGEEGKLTYYHELLAFWHCEWMKVFTLTFRYCSYLYPNASKTLFNDKVSESRERCYTYRLYYCYYWCSRRSTTEITYSIKNYIGASLNVLWSMILVSFEHVLNSYVSVWLCLFS